MDENLLNLMSNEIFDVDQKEQINFLKQKASKKRGRGFELNSIICRPVSGNSVLLSTDDNVSDSSDCVNEDSECCAQRSVEGWILFVNNIHEEADAADIMEVFQDYGAVKNLHLNLDRRTGYVKGYALIEYETYVEAIAAKEGINGKQILGEIVQVDWAFRKNPIRVQTYLRRHRKRIPNK